MVDQPRQTEGRVGDGGSGVDGGEPGRVVEDPGPGRQRLGQCAQPAQQERTPAGPVHRPGIVGERLAQGDEGGQGCGIAGAVEEPAYLFTGAFGDGIGEERHGFSGREGGGGSVMGFGP
ncbi:hypothetical protein SMICM17S_12650 [Streptomyces microflavus]